MTHDVGDPEDALVALDELRPGEMATRRQTLGKWRKDVLTVIQGTVFVWALSPHPARPGVR